MPNDANCPSARRTTARRLAACVALTAGMAGAFAQADEPIKPIPLNATVDARKAALGDRLFHDKRLSKDNTLSCASCHDLAKGGVDGQVSSTGISELEFRPDWTALHRMNTLAHLEGAPATR